NTSSAVCAWRGPARWDRRSLGELARLAGWLALTTVIGVVTNSLDTLTLTALAGPAEAGIYAAGRTLALPLLLTAAALGTVLLPRMSRLPGPTQVTRYVRQLTPWVAGAGGLLAAGAMVAAPLAVRLLYSERYAGAAEVTRILALAYAVQIGAWPMLAALMALNRPDLIAWLSLGVLGLAAAGYLVVTPAYGAIGAAWVLLCACLAIVGPYALALRHAARRAVQTDARAAGGVGSPHRPGGEGVPIEQP
ncbi:MAG: oligosaccharide flippase family protein, partial [Chloroflexales bacterium]|nr:oligosaccharide flippase family protein [Chloroflexales bacterium]